MSTDLDLPDPTLTTHTAPHMITVGMGRGKAYSARQTVLRAVTAAANGASTSSDLLGPVVTQEIRDRLASGEPLQAVTEDLWRRLTTIPEMTLQTADLNGSSHGH